MSAARKPRVVRATELSRVLDVLAQKGAPILATEVLPGGIVRLHHVAPSSDDVSDLEAERREWAAALGG
jgi:hypothetical protein